MRWRGAFARTVQAVENFKALGIHVHTNTTLCAENVEHAEGLVRFVARELHQPVLSMNMVIRTGNARTGGVELSYSEVAARLPGLQETARAEGVKLVWYSPMPYCVFNPVLHGLEIVRSMTRAILVRQGRTLGMIGVPLVVTGSVFGVLPLLVMPNDAVAWSPATTVVFSLLGLVGAVMIAGSRRPGAPVRASKSPSTPPSGERS